MLTRLVGANYADERLLRVDTVDEISGEKLSFIRESLCGHITPSAGEHTTVKRDVTTVPIRCDPLEVVP